MSSLNKVSIIGNLGKDPEIRMTQGGTKCANFTIATSERWTNKQTGQKEEKTEWHRLVAWGSLAEIIEKYVKKGSKVYLEGKLETRKWTDKDNIERYTTEIKVDEMVMLDSKASNDNDGGRDFGAKQSDRAPAPKKVSDDQPFDDEIPF